MKITAFNEVLWGLTTFNEIGYDKESKKLLIFFHNGEILEFQAIEEKNIFDLIISQHKEELIQNHFKKLFPHIIRNHIPMQL